MIERDKSPSAPLADEFIRNFMQDEPIPGIAYEYGLSQRFLPTITLEEVNRLAKTWVPDGNRVVTVTATGGRQTAHADRDGAGRGDQGRQRREDGRVRRHRRAASRCSTRCPNPGTVAATKTHRRRPA